MNEGKEDYRRYNVQCTKYQVPCIKYQVQCTPPSAGRQDPSEVRFGSEHEYLLCTSYLVLGTVLEFPLLHSSISVQRSIFSAAADK